jgi:hypothetical protein
MSNTITPMSVGDIFDKIIKLIGKTGLRNLIIAFIIVAPATVVFTYGIDTLLSTVLGIVREHGTIEKANPESLSALGGGFIVLSVSLLLFGLATLAGTLGITVVACGEMTGRSLAWNEALAMTFDMRLLYVFGQAILQYLAIASLLTIPFLVIVMAGIAQMVAVGVLGGFLFVPAIFFSIFLAVRWAFTLPVIACEGAGVIESFKRSWYLVGGIWWRTFGVLILLTLVAQFAISIITTPISLLVLWDFFAQYFNILSSLGTSDPDPSVFLDLFDSSFGIGIGIMSCLSTVLSLLVTPLATAVMYFDLRARKGEFTGSASVDYTP